MVHRLTQGDEILVSTNLCLNYAKLKTLRSVLYTAKISVLREALTAVLKLLLKPPVHQKYGSSSS